MMKGLVIKDFIMMKKSIVLYLAIFAIYGFLGVVTGNAGMMVVFSVMLAGVLPVNSIAYDERYHWDNFAPVLPQGRKQIILSKYVFGVLLTAFSFVINIPVFSMRAIKRTDMFDGIADVFFFDIVIACMCLIIQAVTLPINIKFGTKKSRIIMMIICAVPVAVLVSASMIASASGHPFKFSGEVPDFIILATFIIVSIILYAVSIKISTKWYDAKEF